LRENVYQAQFMKRLRKRFPGCFVLKNDPCYQQGVPDWIVLIGPLWAALEVKANESSRRQPNQGYFVEQLNNMSFAAFVYPENENEVLDALQSAAEAGFNARFS
jgi:hypothetical protein